MSADHETRLLRAGRTEGARTAASWARVVCLSLLATACSRPASEAPPDAGRDATPDVADDIRRETTTDAPHGRDARESGMQSTTEGLRPSGRCTSTLVDPSRSTPANGTTPAHRGRVLPSDVWYPATASSPEASTPNAPLDPRDEPYPLVVFVHGSFGTSQQSTFLMGALASRGYVVVAGNYPLTWIDTPGGESDEHCDMQVGDVSFLADQLLSLSASSSATLHGALDPAAGFGVLGHSTGGSVTLAAAFGPLNHDPRVRAAVALAPDACFFSRSFFRTRSVPLMVIAGTDDRFVPPGDNGVLAYDEAIGIKRLALLVGGQHLGFTDFDVSDPTVTPDSNHSAITLAFEAAEELVPVTAASSQRSAWILGCRSRPSIA